MRYLGWGVLLAIVALSPLALAETRTISIRNFEFESPVTIPVGDSVVWRNFDSASHTATSNDGSFDTGTIPPSSSSSAIVFSREGTFSYFCRFHPYMRATLEVVSSSPPNKPPTIEIVSPTPGSRVSGTVRIEGRAYDPEGDPILVEVRIDSGPWNPAQGSLTWSLEWDTRSLPNGNHSLQAQAKAGGSTTLSKVVVVEVDNPPPPNRPPVVEISSPPNGSRVTGEVRIEGTSHDPDGTVVRVEVELDGLEWVEAWGTESWSWIWNSTKSTEGNHTLKARATDEKGAVGYSALWRLEVVPTPPTPPPPPADLPPTLTIRSPPPHALLSGVVRVVVESRDPEKGALTVSLLVDGRSVGNLSPQEEGVWELLWNSTLVPEGPHTLTVVSQDATHSTEESVEVEVRHPTSLHLGVEHPTEGALLRGVVEAHGSVSEGSTLEVRLDDGPWERALVERDLWRISLDLSGIPSGNHTLFVRATWGSLVKVASIHVRILPPRAPPSLVLLTTPPERVSGSVLFRGTAKDPEGSFVVEWRVDGGPWNPAKGSESWTVLWNTTGVPPGPHRLEFRARGEGGTSPPVSVVIEVLSPSPPSTEVPFPSFELLLLLPWVAFRRGCGGDRPRSPP